MKRYNFLFGLNFLAIVLIFIDHFVFKRNIYTNETFPYTFFRDGMNGIFILFATTGFWVTKKILWLKETNQYNPIKYGLLELLKRYPVFFVYLSFVWYSGWFDNVKPESIQSALFLTFNYTGSPHSDVIMHFWAFCAKENVIFLMFIPILSFFNRKISMIILLLIGCISFGVRADWFYSGNGQFDWYKYMQTHILLYCFTFSAALAMLEENQVIKKLFTKFKLGWFAILLMVIIGPYLESVMGVPYAWLYKSLVASIGFSLICAHCMYLPEGKLSRFLGNKIFMYAGGMYLSIYLWQQPYTFFFYNAQTPLNKIPLYVAYSLGLGIAAYVLVEFPLKKIVKKFS